MIKIDKRFIDTTLENLQIIEDAANEIKSVIIAKYSEYTIKYSKEFNDSLDLYYGMKHCSFNCVDVDDILFTGAETWRFGGYQAHAERFPISWLYSDNWQDELTAMFEKEFKTKRKEKDEIKKAEYKEKYRQYSKMMKDLQQTPMLYSDWVEILTKKGN